MPDITMCKGIHKDSGEERMCPQKTKCFRHVAKEDSYRQVWFVNAPLKPDNSCDHFMSIHKKAVEELDTKPITEDIDAPFDKEKDDDD